MRIDTLQFDDLQADWHLDEVHFDSINLLVGASAVGKTRILNSLERLKNLTILNHHSGSMRWRLRFSHDGKSYQWEGETAAPPKQSDFIHPEIPLFGAPSSELVSERLTSESTVFEREGDRFVFGEQALPKLSRAVSAMKLLNQEPRVQQPVLGLFRILFSDAAAVKPFDIAEAQLTEQMQSWSSLKDNPDTFRPFGAAQLGPATVLLAYILQEVFPTEFERWKQAFIGVFPAIKDLQVVASKGLLPSMVRLTIAARESGVGRWIPQTEMASGMLKTLVHLLEMRVVPAGSVIVVDEFENGLGVNCMPAVVDLLSERSGDIQYILTSHHPYVINQLPWQTWKLVRRTGNRVTVTSARDLSGMKPASHLDAFTRLINLPEYEESIR